MDWIYLLLTTAFFGLSVLLVRSTGLRKQAADIRALDAQSPDAKVYTPCVFIN